MKWKKDLGKRLKNERKSWGMSRRRLAKLSHVDIEVIEEIENGIIKDPDLFDMLNICEALESSIYYYLKKPVKLFGVFL